MKERERQKEQEGESDRERVRERARERESERGGLSPLKIAFPPPRAQNCLSLAWE